jgi:hypothetical protein
MNPFFCALYICEKKTSHICKLPFSLIEKRTALHIKIGVITKHLDMTATNTKRLTSFLREFHLYRNNKETFLLRLRSFNLTDEEVKEYYSAIRKVTRHDKGIEHWSIASRYFSREYWFESIRELERNIHLSLDDTLNDDLCNLNETINTISQSNYQHK